jgi:hypothetical protein
MDKIDIRPIAQKWFDEAIPVNASVASTTIGSGDNGVVTILTDAVGTEGNSYTIAVNAGTEVDEDMTAVLTGTDIVVTLGTTPSVASSINVGSGTNGVVTIVADVAGEDGDDYSITVLTNGANGCAMSAALVGTDITVTLGKTVADLEPTKNTATLIAAAITALDGVTATASGTGATAIGTGVSKTNFTGGDDGGALDGSKNTATLVAGAIDALVGVNADASGTGVTALTQAVQEKAFTGGIYGTPCPEIGIALMKVVNGRDTYYLSTKADNTRFNDGWKSFTLTTM